MAVDIGVNAGPNVRQPVHRTSDGTTWFFHIEGSALKLRYSRDDGNTWTATAWSRTLFNNDATVAMTPAGLFVVAERTPTYTFSVLAAYQIDLQAATVSGLLGSAEGSFPSSNDGSNIYWAADLLVRERPGGGWHVLMATGENHTSYTASRLVSYTLSAAYAWSAYSHVTWLSSSGNSRSYLAWKGDGSGFVGAGDGALVALNDTNLWTVTWSGSAWSANSPDPISGHSFSARYNAGTGLVHDGTKTIIFGVRPNVAASLWEHTTPGTAPVGVAINATGGPASWGDVDDVALSTDDQGNIVLSIVDRGVNLWQRVRQDGVLDASWTALGPAWDALSSSKYAHGQSHGLVYLDAADNYTWHAVSFNVPPNAPTLSTMAAGEIVDRAATNRASHAFSDPDPGDSQSAFDHRYRLVGSSTWTEAHAPTPNGYVDYPAGTFAAGDYERQVRTYDAQGAVGPWSSSGFFTAADAPATPTITAPVHLATIGQSSVEVTWSTAAQTAYQLQVLDGGLVEYDSGQVAHATLRSRTVPLPVNNEDRTIRVRIRDYGLWSAWYSITVSVSYTPPPVPVVVLQASGAALVVTVNNPAPAVGEPNVTHNRVMVDDGLDDGETVRVAELAPNGSWTYWTPRSGLDYEGRVRVVAVADNGTEASSA